MRFGPFPLDEAEGAILAHSTRIEGRAFKKGRVLSAEDVDALRGAGFLEVIAARLEPGDVHEDRAAAEIAEAASGENVEVAAAFTGRSNLYARTHGIVLIDRARVDRLNLLHESVTVATLPPHAVVEPRQMLATIKIIPFAAPEGCVAAARRIAGEDGPLVRVAPFVAKAVGLVSTRLPGMKESLLDKNVQSVSARLEALNSRLAGERRCAHEEGAIAAAIRELLADGCDPVLVFGASAIVDRRDVVPSGIEKAGGTIDHFGMPVDPGNLLLLGHVGNVPVLGLPGCARSPKINGYDWVLQRLLADIPVTGRDIMLMGCGGLLAEIETRPQPREGDMKRPEPAKAPVIAAFILAAGQSRRMGALNKLLIEIEGKPMVRHVAETVLASRARPVVVVTGHEAERVEAALNGLDVHFAHNPNHAEGLSTSLKHGLDALPGELDGVLVCLGDMPALRPEHLNRLIASFNPIESRAICVPTVRGKRGNPVLFGAQFFTEMKAVEGDVGARHLIGTHADLVCEVPMDALAEVRESAPDRQSAIHVDIDTPEALAAYRHRAPA